MFIIKNLRNVLIKNNNINKNMYQTLCYIFYFKVPLSILKL